MEDTSNDGGKLFLTPPITCHGRYGLREFRFLGSHSVGGLGYILPAEHCGYKVPVEFVLCGPLRLLSHVKIDTFLLVSNQYVCQRTFLTSQYFRLK